MRAAGKIKAVFGERGDRGKRQKVYRHLKDTQKSLVLTGDLKDATV